MFKKFPKKIQNFKAVHPIYSKKMPIVVGVFGVDGEAKQNCKVMARSITRVEDNEVVLSNVPFKLYAPRKDDAKEKHFR